MPYKDKEKHNEYRRNVYHSRRKWAINLLGGKCNNCGTTNSLEFDHVDPSEKNFHIARRLQNAKIEELQAELELCQLLCHDCHEEKNRKDNGEAKHGSLAMYSHYKCRCPDCKEVWNKKSREYKKKKLSGLV